MSSDSVGGEGDSFAPIESEAVAAFAGISSDDTGTTTFERFQWQAKLAVRSWLGMLAGDGTLAVLCEHVEDLAFVEASGFCFAQLKTRDRGSWSVAKICEKGHAVDRLAASYDLADAAGIVDRSRFEVWLEGPPSEAKETTDFFNDPTSATSITKKKIRDFGLKGVKLDDFLERLSVRCHQPARSCIDAVVIRLLGAIWPALTMDQLERLYESLLLAAESAQSATALPPSVRAAMRAAQVNPMEDGVWDPIASKSLTEDQLRAICPPLPADTDQELLARAATGEATVLELKLVRAGAREATVRNALVARADADVAATTARASGVMTADSERSLDLRLLDTAHSIASLAASSGVTMQRPGEHIFHTLMSNAANTAALDLDRLYNRDHRLLVGHLCTVSDQCRFGWGVS
ncbi:dsDNA nuclease domain-containing protein [Mycobacterium riyadhense]|uniref:CD-NTase associated protein 4-like DNA endonuclease domain-containing protein n=1 Tax=Mycobacterium riyadhense TaxID=486698 RepID=A0A1X2CE83_9MYCO|nr:dsDNA nuclease domain-containing protein [Mycobacterium riyadhense]MCV7144646.1 DUF4297 domain-containing protein [Mycobacterium riyadhense]ORW74113.1 hypothetical protein AWC22_23610 [Mycobacterium riyadhense]